MHLVGHSRAPGSLRNDLASERRGGLLPPESVGMRAFHIEGLRPDADQFAFREPPAWVVRFEPLPESGFGLASLTHKKECPVPIVCLGYLVGGDCSPGRGTSSAPGS